MNFDIAWQNLRYVLLAISTASLALGWLSKEHSDQLGQIANDAAVWGQIGGAVGMILTWVWGNWVKWRTKAVPEIVAGNPSIPTVSGATGKIEDGEKFVMTPEVQQQAYGLMASAPHRSYAGLALPYSLPAWKLRAGYSYIVPYWNRIPARTSNKIADAVKNNTGVTFTKEDFDGLPEDLWSQLRPYL